jgi:hypothetical protein
MKIFLKKYFTVVIIAIGISLAAYANFNPAPPPIIYETGILYRTYSWYYVNGETKSIKYEFVTAGTEARPAYKADAEAVAKLKYMADVLNYLSNKGWQIAAGYNYEGEDWRNEVIFMQRPKS